MVRPRIRAAVFGAILLLTSWTASATIKSLRTSSDINSESQGKSRQRDPQAELKNAIVARLRAARLRISSDGMKSIDGLVSEAKTRYDSSRRSEATSNAASLGDEIARSARSGDGSVTASDVASALKRVCPLWPFC